MHMGALLAGCVTVPIYPETNQQQVRDFISACDCKLVWVDGGTQYEKIKNIKKDVNSVK